jgi:hypothetical protein
MEMSQISLHRTVMYYSRASLLRRGGTSSGPVSLHVSPRCWRSIKAALPRNIRSLTTGAMQRSEGTIEDIFTSFHTAPPFPPRFADLKKDIWSDQLIESWREILAQLEEVTGRVIAQGSQVNASLFCFALLYIGSY